MTDQPASPDVVTIEVPDADPAAPAPATPPSDDPQEGIDALRRQLAESRQREIQARALAEEEGRRRAEAESQAQAHAGRAQQASLEADARGYDSLVNAIAATQKDMDSSKADLKKAMEEGDYDKAVDAQARIALLAGRLTQMEAGKSAADEERQRRRDAPPPVPQPQPPRIDWDRPWTAGESETVLRGYSAPTAAWIRAHPAFSADPGFRRQVIAADGMAKARGHAPDTEAYFREVERLVGLDTAPEPPPAADPVLVAPAIRPAAVPAAPPSRQVPSAQPTSRGTQVTLTREEREIAPIMFPKLSAADPDPDVAYARYKAEALRAGAYDKFR